MKSRIERRRGGRPVRGLASFRLAALLFTVACALALGCALGKGAGASSQQNQDKEAIDLLRQSARMLRDAAADAGSDRTCIMSWANFIDCTADKVGNGALMRCTKPKCSFGNAQLAEMIESLDLEELNEKADSSSTLPRPSGSASSAPGSQPPSGSSSPRATGGSNTPVNNSSGNSASHPNGASGTSGTASSAEGRATNGSAASARPGARAGQESKGRWVTDTFHPTCWGSDKLFLNTYLTATVVNSKGDPSCSGAFLQINNHSRRFSAFYGISADAGVELKPGESRTISITAKNGKGGTIDVNLSVKYWDDSLPSASGGSTAPVSSGGSSETRPTGGGASGNESNPSAKGRWVTDTFHPTCWGSDKLFLNTYLTSTVMNSKGDPSCTGAFLQINNHSRRFSAYATINSETTFELKPGESKTVPVRAKNGKGGTTEVNLTVKYWDDK